MFITYISEYMCNDKKFVKRETINRSFIENIWSGVFTNVDYCLT